MPRVLSALKWDYTTYTYRCMSSSDHVIDTAIWLELTAWYMVQGLFGISFVRPGRG